VHLSSDDEEVALLPEEEVVNKCTIVIDLMLLIYLFIYLFTYLC